jgi:hypothetical protein
MPFLIRSAVRSRARRKGSSNADYGCLRRFSYSRDVIAVGGVPNPPHKASTSPRAGWNPGLRTSSLEWDQEFESVFLQRRVMSEPGRSVLASDVMPQLSI